MPSTLKGNQKYEGVTNLGINNQCSFHIFYAQLITCFENVKLMLRFVGKILVEQLFLYFLHFFFALFLTPNNYDITTMRNITDDSTVDLSRYMRSTFDGIPCVMLQISCKSFPLLIRMISHFPGIKTQTSQHRSINEPLVKSLDQGGFHFFTFLIN